MAGHGERQLLDALKEAAKIEDVVGRDVQLRRAGALMKGLCPFHEERTASFTVWPGGRDGHYFCFGCREGGDAIRFVMRHRALSFAEAVGALCGEYGVDEAGLLFGTRAAAPRAQGSLERQGTAIDAAARFYEARLWGTDGERARAELVRRGISEATARLFRLGYAPATWSALRDEMRRLSCSPEDACGADLLAVRRDGGGYRDVFVDRLVCPIEDARGRVVAFSGRALGAPQDGVPKYLNTRGTPLFKKDRTLFGWRLARVAARKAGTLVIVEGNFDCVRMHEAGFENVAATMGTSLSLSHATQVARECRSAVLMFDGDDAGRRAAPEAVAELLAAKVDVHVADLPPGMDPDEACRVIGAEGVRAAIAAARDGVEWSAENLRAEHPNALSWPRMQITAMIARLADETDSMDASVKAARILACDAGALFHDAYRRRGGVSPPPVEPNRAAEALVRAVAHALAEPGSRDNAEWVELRRMCFGGPLYPALNAAADDDPYDAIDAVADAPTRDALSRAYATQPWVDAKSNLADDVTSAVDKLSVLHALREASARMAEDDEKIERFEAAVVASAAEAARRGESKN